MHQKDGNRRKFLNYCFNKIVEIERFALRAAILDECQNYLGGGGRLVCYTAVFSVVGSLRDDTENGCVAD